MHFRSGRAMKYTVFLNAKYIFEIIKKKITEFTPYRDLSDIKWEID